MTAIEYIYRMKFRCFVDFAFRELHPDEAFLDNWHVQFMADMKRLWKQYQREFG